MRGDETKSDGSSDLRCFDYDGGSATHCVKASQTAAYLPPLEVGSVVGRSLRITIIGTNISVRTTFAVKTTKRRGWLVLFCCHHLVARYSYLVVMLRKAER